VSHALDDSAGDCPVPGDGPTSTTTQTCLIPRHTNRQMLCGRCATLLEEEGNVGIQVMANRGLRR